MKRGLEKRGFSFIEVISPCTTGYGRLNRMSPVDMMRALRDFGKIKKVPPMEATIDLTREIVLGEFVDIEKPTYNDVFSSLYGKAGAS